ncbi:MAG TPA: head-tail connector protein [Candidatus Rifleibacterium sp.]|nr:head-tail connector protein [Candidatus Rifleibacterium sp.]
MLKYKITTQPAAEPVTLAEAKVHLRIIDDTEQDSLIEALIGVAREYAENVTGRALITRTVTAVCDAFPVGDSIELPVGPLVDVTSVNYTDTDATTTAFADYTADDYSQPPRIVLNDSASWPSANLAPVNPISIVYRAGFGSSGADVPKTIRQAILLLVGHWFENREAAITGAETFSVPFAAETLLQQWRHAHL